MTVNLLLSVPQAEANPRLKGLNKRTPDIITTVEAGGRATLIKFAIHLKSQELISETIHNQAKQAPTVLEGADMLMTAIKHEVKKNPTNFIRFLTALRSSDLSNEADMLETEYSEYRKKL